MTAPTVAVVGASADRKKFGNKAVRAYKNAGWTVFPVNPRATEIEGLPCYASLRDVPRPIDRVTLYLPPDRGIQVLDDIAAVRPREFFVNPGADSPELIQAARDRGLDPIVACSILALGVRPEDLAD